MMMRQRFATASRRLSTAAGMRGHELLHSSRIPTLHFQNSLPKLPVPALEDSLRRLMLASQPIMSRIEYEELCKLAEDFGAAEGAKLQEALVAGDRLKYSSFITEPWFDMYLADRRPLLLNSNPQLTFVDEEGEGRSTQEGRAARLVHAACTFMRTLDAGKLTPDIFHLYPSRSKTPFFDEVSRVSAQHAQHAQHEQHAQTGVRGTECADGPAPTAPRRRPQSVRRFTSRLA